MKNIMPKHLNIYYDISHITEYNMSNRINYRNCDIDLIATMDKDAAESITELFISNDETYPKIKTIDISLFINAIDICICSSTRLIVKGLDRCTNLKFLLFNGVKFDGFANQSLESLSLNDWYDNTFDLTGFTDLKSFHIYYNLLEKLDISGLSQLTCLEEIDISTSANVTGHIFNTNVKKLICNCETIDVMFDLPKLEHLSIDISNTKLLDHFADNTAFTKLTLLLSSDTRLSKIYDNIKSLVIDYEANSLGYFDITELIICFPSIEQLTISKELVNICNNIDFSSLVYLKQINECDVKEYIRLRDNVILTPYKPLEKNIARLLMMNNNYDDNLRQHITSELNNSYHFISRTTITDVCSNVTVEMIVKAIIKSMKSYDNDKKNSIIAKMNSIFKTYEDNDVTIVAENLFKALDGEFGIVMDIEKHDLKRKLAGLQRQIDELKDSIV